MGKPVVTVRDGAISASVFKNENGDGKAYYSTNIQRVYEDSEGNLKNTSSFNTRDLLQVSRLCQKAYDEVRVLEQSEAAANVAVI